MMVATPPPIRFTLDWDEAARRLSEGRFTPRQAKKYLITLAVVLFFMGGSPLFFAVSILLCMHGDRAPRRNILNFGVRFAYTTMILMVRYLIVIALLCIPAAFLFGWFVPKVPVPLVASAIILALLLLGYYVWLMYEQYLTHKKIAPTAPLTYPEPQ
jgi:hypothetical protein